MKIHGINLKLEFAECKIQSKEYITLQKSKFDFLKNNIVIYYNMANFKDSPYYAKYDDYYTTEDTWRMIEHLIPKDKTIWEACMLNSSKSNSPQILKNIVGHDNVYYDTSLDILEGSIGSDIIITNIPFETNIKKKILQRLVELDRPFIIIMNSCNMFSKYLRNIFKDNIKHLQIITPGTKIHYAKLLEDGTLEYKKNTSFYSVFVAYKMNLSTEQLWV
jgi:hypothetical protein